MNKKLNSILLVDDNAADNRYHQIIIEDLNITDSIQIVENGLEALDFLKKESQTHPELIFLDINMPKMNGWEFLEAYKNLLPNQKANAVIMMLTTSINPEDKKRAEAIPEINGFHVKPLSEEALMDILGRYFKDGH